jgi:hypothetical protein
MCEHPTVIDGMCGACGEDLRKRLAKSIYFFLIIKYMNLKYQNSYFNIYFVGKCIFKK